MDATKNIYSAGLKPEKKTIKLKKKEPLERGVSPRAILKPMANKPILPQSELSGLGKIGVNTSTVIKMPARKIKLTNSN